MAQALARARDDALDCCLLLALPGFVPPCREPRRPLAFEPFRSRFVALPVLAGASQALFVRPGFPGLDHVDAVDGAGRHTQPATGAFGRDHRMHEPRRPDDGIHRARLDAQRAADAGLLVDDGHSRGFGGTLRHLPTAEF